MDDPGPRKSRCQNLSLPFMFLSVYNQQTLSRDSSEHVTRDFGFYVVARHGEICYGAGGEGDEATAPEGEVSEEAVGVGF